MCYTRPKFVLILNAEKVDFVVKYLLNIANNQELNDFMGKDTDEAVLYNETDIRGVIAQMPELVFYEYYYKFIKKNKDSPSSTSVGRGGII